MMIPRRKDFFDEVFDEPIFSKKEAKIMKTDIKEKDGNYVFKMELPGVEKENVNIDLENGYLTVSATVNKDVEEEEKKEKYIYKERYVGESSRSFYVGDFVTEEDVKASFKNGILTIVVPVQKEVEQEAKKRIQID